MHAVIIDDEVSGVKSLELLLKKFSADVSVIASATDPAEGVGLINRLRPDIVFLDIQMPDINGFELLKKLTYTGFSLVFITAHQEHALRALKINAFDYLLKPIDWDDLGNTIDRIKKQQQATPNVPEIFALVNEVLGTKQVKVLIPTKDMVEYVLPGHILYLEAHSNQCAVHLHDGKLLLANKTLKQFETQLCGNRLPFFRLQNSFIINLDFVVRYSKEEGGHVTMKDRKSIPVSKAKKEELLRLLNLGD